MPDDLLRYVIGPTSALGWAWLAAALAIAVILWYVVVWVWTTPRRRAPAVVRRVQDALQRRRFANAARHIDRRYRAGELDGAAAAAGLSVVVRDFLHQATGTRTQYLQLGEFDTGVLTGAAPLMQRLNDVQFNPRSGEDAGQLGPAAEELILSWT